MKVAILEPYRLPFIRGNSLSVHRLISALRDKKVDVKEICISDYKHKKDIYRDVSSFKPDIIHGFHGYKTGRVVLYLKKRMYVPIIISLRGTDFNLDLFNSKRRTIVLETLNSADIIIVFAPFTKEIIKKENPELNSDKVHIIPHAVRLKESSYNIKDELNLKKDHFVFFLPGGIRRVKNVEFCLKPLSRLRKSYPQIKLIYAGAIIEKRSGLRLIERIRSLGWVIYLGAVPHERMYSLYKISHVIMNTSLSEGMPNSLLEAMSLGKAVLASKISGNQAIVENEEDGLLFETEEEFIKKVERLIRDKDLRKRLGKKAKEKIRQYHTPKKELGEHMKIYKGLLSSD